MNSKRARRELDAETYEQLEDLLSKDKNDLSSGDVAFLLARQDYLDKDEIDEVKKTEGAKTLKKELDKKAKAESEDKSKKAPKEEKTGPDADAKPE